jgi:hypothetical protein
MNIAMKKLLITTCCVLLILVAAPVVYIGAWKSPQGQIMNAGRPYIPQGNTYIIYGATGNVQLTTRKPNHWRRACEELQPPLHAARIALAFN